ncbi:MAG: prepilin-type N-terminal cleavage/methylation domain-containing protein [Fibrobacteraceae bacterium]|nr:prepilin-type N-terminal cleavage/methylation domain-containing protein [Fibrobacteraceae bacterium]
MKKNKGSTLIEVLISTALVGTTAVTLLGFLHGGKLASKAPHEDYGAELCKEVLYSRIAKKDSILDFANTGGMPFKVVVKALTDGEEHCFSARAVRGGDSLRRFVYCVYGEKL